MEKYILSPEDSYNLYKLLYEVVKILDQNNIPYWASGGTFLGAIRCKGIIKWDDDLDLCVLYKDKPKLKKIIEKDKRFIFDESNTLIDKIRYKAGIYPFVDIFFMVPELEGGQIIYKCSSKSARNKFKYEYYLEKELVPLKKDRPQNLTEGEREHCQIDARQPDAEPAEDRRSQSGDERGERETRLHRQARTQHQQCGRVGAQTKVGGMAKRMHTGWTHDEVQAAGKECSRHQVDGQHDRVGRLCAQPWQRQEQPNAADPEELVDGPRQPKGGFRGAGLSGWGLRSTQQAPGPDHEHDGHDQKFNDEREF